MEREKPTDKCARPACNCAAQDAAGGYCSEECKNASPTENTCQCGHAGCR